MTMTLASLPYVPARNTSGNRPLSDIRMIVIHTPETPESPTAAEGVANYFKNGPPNVGSTHIVVDSNSAVRCVHDHVIAWGAEGGNANSTGWHVEGCGYAAQTKDDWSDTYSRAMLVNMAALCREEAELRDISLNWMSHPQLTNLISKGFVTHADITAAFNVRGGHTDPGPNFPRDLFIDMVRSARNPTPTQLVEFFALIQHLNNRRRFPMWLISHSDGAIYTWNGVHGWHIPDIISVRIQQDLMRQLGLPTEIVADQDYFIDRLRETGVLTK